MSNVRDPDVALVWGSLSLLEKFSSPNQQGAVGVPMSVCFVVGAGGSGKERLLVKSQEAQGLWSAGMSGTAVFREKEGPKCVYLPSLRVPGEVPSQQRLLVWAGSGDMEHISLLHTCNPSTKPRAWHMANTQCLLNE